MRKLLPFLALDTSVCQRKHVGLAIYTCSRAHFCAKTLFFKKFLFALARRDKTSYNYHAFCFLMTKKKGGATMPKPNFLKNCAVINDLSGFGRCALTVSLPILSALGVRACPFPTAILSNHTGFEEYYFSDFTENMEPYFENWEKLGLHFDGIYTGFLGSERQVDIISKFADKFKTADTLLFVDPVMGDHGRLYSTYTPHLVDRMTELSARADVGTPNLTELSFLTDIPYDELIVADDEKIFELAKSLGAGKAVVTGVRRKNRVCNLAIDCKSGARFCASSRYIGGEYCGTGDLFASLLCGYMINGLSLSRALSRATVFLKAAVKNSAKIGVSPLDGIAFEPTLRRLF